MKAANPGGGIEKGGIMGGNANGGIPGMLAGNPGIGGIATGGIGGGASALRPGGARSGECIMPGELLPVSNGS